MSLRIRRHIFGIRQIQIQALYWRTTEIVAFTDILPVKQEILQQIVNGTFNDKYLTPENLIDMDSLKEGDTFNLCSPV
jgi:hypothetical protein